MRPVFKTTKNEKWKSIPTPLEFVDNDEDDCLNVAFRFQFVPDIKEYWFAYCYPFSYEENQVNNLINIILMNF